MSELFDVHGPFTTGHADIDAEHDQLHFQAKRLAMMLARGEDMVATTAVLANFITLLETHFKHEEMYFGVLEPHRAEAHRNEHKMLVLSLKLFAKSVKERDDLENWTDFVSLDDLLLKHAILFDLELRP
ncbi:MAG: hypothetical protein NUV50_04855 [Rhodospirillales bacterium]|nr:hypothetical protein [Rhodospirillales bacterium]